MAVVETQQPKVLNAHHFGGVAGLPPTAKYVGRPSDYGNPYSSKSGAMTREHCVAKHRVDVYHRLITDPEYKPKITADLMGYDLACWCAQPSRYVACHARNYLHLFSPSIIERSYTKTVAHYLLQDLSGAFGVLEHTPYDDAAGSYLDQAILIQDTILYAQEAVRVSKGMMTAEDRCVFIATLVVDIEAAAHDRQPQGRHYRLNHAIWVANRCISGLPADTYEPQPPHILLKRRAADAST